MSPRRPALDLRTLNALCAKLKGAAKSVQWGDSTVWKIGGKMFAMGTARPGEGFHCSFKVSETSFEMLIDSGAAVPAPYLARAGWVALSRANALTKDEFAAYLAQAHALIAAKLPKKTRAALGLLD